MSAPELRRELSLLDTSAVVIGAIIGVGIFFTPSRVARLAGDSDLALLAWALGGVIALSGALTFAELGSRYPRSGAQYLVLRDAWGPAIGFLFVVCNATAIQAGATAIIAIVCAQHLASALGSADPASAWLVATAVLLIAGLCGANAIGVRWGSRVQNLTVYAKLLTLAAVTVIAGLAPPAPELALAAGAAETGTRAAGAGLLGLLFAALVPTLFSFGGWQQALWLGGEVKDPERNVPRAIIGGVLVVIAAYLAVNWAYLRLLGHAGVAASQTLAADAVSAGLPVAGGARIVALAVALSALGVLNAQLLAGPRLIHALARDGRFFAAFAAIDARYATPLRAVLLLGGLAVALLLLAGASGVDQLLTGIVFVDGVFFVLTGLALFRLRRREPGRPSPVKVPVYPVVPALFAVGETAVVIGAYTDPAVRGAALLGLGWIGAAIALYVLRFRKAGRSPG